MKGVEYKFMKRKELKRVKILFTLLLLFSFTFGLFPGSIRATDAEELDMDNDTFISEDLKADQEETLEEGENPIFVEEDPEQQEEIDQPISEPEDNNNEETENVVDDLTEEGEEAEDNPQEEEDEVLVSKDDEYSAKTLSVEVEGAKIEIKAIQGILPEGTELVVKALLGSESDLYLNSIKDTNGTGLENFRAFDITLLDKEGSEIQPNGNVTVNISGLEFVEDSSKVVAYHIQPKAEMSKYSVNNVNDDIKINEISAESSSEEVTFETNHFSIYGVGTKATATYNFYVGTELKDIQIVLDGEILQEPETPEKIEKKRFKGWQIEGGSFIDFSQPITIIGTASTTIKVNAIYEDIVYVYFLYDDNGDNQYDVLATKELAPGGITNASNVSPVVNISGKVFDHWSLTEGGAAFNFNTPINADTNLYAVLADRWTVTFDAQGGSPMLPKTVINGGTIGGQIGTTARAGYTFKYWSKTAGGSAFNLNTPITEDFTLFAVWQAATANYSIIYWQENADDTDYTYKETVIEIGDTESMIALPNNRIANNRYPYFSYKEYDTGKTIKGDGSTVVNVYYSRKVYTIKFDLNRSGSTLNIGGQTYTGSQYSFTAKYESDISELWPTATNIPDVVTRYNRYQFYGWPAGGSSTYVSKRLNLTSDLLPTSGTTRTYTGSWRTDLSLYTLHYMIERLPEETPLGGDKQYGSKWYREDMRYSQQANASGNWSAKTIAGVTNIGTVSESGRNEYFFYNRNSYDLNFYNPTILDKKVTLKYGSSITNESYSPDRPTGVSTDYVFSGWYTNPDLAGNPFNFTGAKMPENNLALYSKWAPPVYSVKYYKTPSNTGPFGTIDNIPSGDKISINQLVGKVIPTGLTEDDFVGWYWNVDNTSIAYDFDTPVINNNYVLYPVWRDSSIYEVTYNAGLGTGNVPEDGNKYKLNAAANVLAPTDLTAPSNLVFIGWNTKADGTGLNYYPNDKLIITGNMTLTAQWGDLVPETTLTYKANGGVGADDVISGLKNNDKHVVKQNTFTRAGYTFLNWKDEQTGITYLPGVEVTVGNGNPMPNVLLAQWEKIKIDITGTKVWVGGFAQKPTIELQLYRNDIAFGAPITLLNSVTQYTWVAYDKTDDLGVDYVYTVKEVGTPAFHSKVETGLQVTNTHSVGQVDVKKAVTGNLGDKTKYFEVDVTFILPVDKTMSTNNSITYMGGKYLTTQTVNDNSQNTFTVTIEVKHSDTVTFSNIPYGVTYTVNEKDYTGTGYITSYEITDNTINTAKDTVTITNHKEVTINTGVFMDSLPYILILSIIGIGGVGGAFWKRKRSNYC